METTTYQRFQSGELCIESGTYLFDGYVDGSLDPPPSADEAEIALGPGDLFPKVRRPGRVCFWKLANGLPVWQPDEVQPAPDLA